MGLWTSVIFFWSSWFWLLWAACSIPSVDVSLRELIFSCGSESLHHDISPVMRLATWLIMQSLPLMLSEIKCVDFGIGFPVPADCSLSGHKQKATGSPSLPSVPLPTMLRGGGAALAVVLTAGASVPSMLMFLGTRMYYYSRCFPGPTCPQYLTLRVPPAQGAVLMGWVLLFTPWRYHLFW